MGAAQVLAVDIDPRSVATTISGHQTESVYRRYAIVSEILADKWPEEMAGSTGLEPATSGLTVRNAGESAASWK